MKTTTFIPIPFARLRTGWLLFWPVLLLLASCGTTRPGFTPQKKYAPSQLQRDYRIYRSLLETRHPGLYWYTAKEEMDRYFDWGAAQITDSLTELEFRKVLLYVTARINCGHTTVRSSRAWNRYGDTARLGKMFPLSMKVWDEAMVVTANLNRRDSLLKRGTVITAIDGKDWREITDTLHRYISGDGYNRTGKNQVLSNRGFFGSLYTTVFGLADAYRIDYRDANGQIRQAVIPVHNPAADTVGRGTRSFLPSAKPSRREQKAARLNAVRLLKVDTASHTAMMDLSSFGKGYGLRKFFHRSFRNLKKHHIRHLIIDVRSNGGGSVTNSTLLTRFISRQPFRISDSLYAISRGGRYASHIQNDFWNRLFIRFLTRRKKDGYYHFGYFERHVFKPRRKNHFDGQVYILTGGNSFSATTLFASAVKGQPGIRLVGEETGGGAYGNSAWLIPDVTLPESGVRFRLPLFRLVMNKEIPHDGRGVIPDVPAPPTVEAIRQNADFKTGKAMELIRAQQ